MVHVERIADTRHHTGEGPLWHPDEQRLYWVDIPAGELHRYDPGTDEHDLAYEAQTGPIGGFTLESDGALLLFTDRTIERYVPGTDATSVVLEVDADTRFNDVIADPAGRVFCGTMPSEDALGTLYRVDPDGSVTMVVDQVDIPNGMGFTDDLSTFYFTESEARRIYAFEYEQSTGDITNRRTFRETAAGDGIPDGLTVDADDHVWSARWNGGRVVRYTPDGEPDVEITVPARKVSSVTFGGPEYGELYLTTALTDADRATEGPGAGAVFRVTDLHATGVPEFRSQIA